MSEKEVFDVTTEVSKEIAKDVYNDAGKPIAKPTGELIGLVPRAIKAALFPLEKWIMQREYNVVETKKILEEKLQNTPAELIESPEPHIAVPAMQNISYCMDNEELREMYANLLANSMNKVMKNGVHPSFVEIIKQLSPDEAKILKYFHNELFIPTVAVKVHKTTGETVIVSELFTDIGEFCDCEDLSGYEKYIDNLVRLGLVKASREQCLVDESKYSPLKNHPYILNKKEYLENLDEISGVEFVKGYMELTAFGKSFCCICLEFQDSNI